MRKILISLFITVYLFAINSAVFAQSIDCEYPEVGLTMTWDTEKEFNAKSNPYVKMSGFDSTGKDINFLIARYQRKIDLSDKASINQKLWKDVKGIYACNSDIYVCVYSSTYVNVLRFAWYAATAGWGSLALDFAVSLYKDVPLPFGVEHDDTLVITTPQEYKNEYAELEDGYFDLFGIRYAFNLWDDGYDFGDFSKGIYSFVTGLIGTKGNPNFYYKQATCQHVKYKGAYTGVNISCGQFKEAVLTYQIGVENYKKCAEKDVGCKADAIGNLNTIENAVKSQCKSLIQSLDYDPDTGESECIEDCKAIATTLNNHTKGTDLYVDYNYGGKCGFTKKLIVWVNNGLKWIKYILPILVIVFGIIDFIKAIASNKEDEMKKTQTKFIRRLIAAALAFLVPLIITFILNKMGFDVYSCGVDVL